MSTKRRRALEAVKTRADGWPECRFCKGPVLPPKRTLCSVTCVHEYKIQSSPSYVRDCLQARDNGLCALCGVDTVALYHELKLLERTNPSALSQRLGEVGVTAKQLARRNELWDADHKVPVAEGGGLVGLDGFQTLCIRCHREKTAEQRARKKNAKT